MSNKGSLVHGIVIDTNVFVHLFNPQNNPDNHIGKLLSALVKNDIFLIVDTTGRIEYEYNKYLKNRISKSIDNPFGDIYSPILKYWFVENKKKRVEVNFEGDLMSAIKEVMDGDKEEGENDRVFVYVTIKKDSVLVTNDKKDMIDERSGDGKRREKILGMAKDMGPEYKHAKIWVSEEAYNAMIRSAGGEYELDEDQVDWKRNRD